MNLWIAERALQAPKNSSVDPINAIFARTIAWGSNILSSADSTCNPRDSNRFLEEFLNKLTPAGLLPHHLYIKKGMVLMLLQSLSTKQEPYNSTRLILNKATNIHLYSKIASVDYARKEVLIPRIKVKHQDDQFIKWNRRQFPVTPAFEIAINKSQGQTLNVVEVGQEEPTFTHGQLYVAASRVGDPKHLHFAVIKSVSRKTRNVVYKEIIRTGDVVSTPTKVPLTCLLLNSDQPKGTVGE